MVYLPKGSGVRFIFIISIMNPFIDDLHKPVVTQNQLRFQASLPDVTQQKVLYNTGTWTLLRHSSRIHFCFWVPIKIPWDNICRKLVFMMKAQTESIAIWGISVPKSLHCLYDRRGIKSPKPPLLTKQRVCNPKTWRRFAGH